MFLFAPIRLAFRLVSLLVSATVIYIIFSGVQVVTASNASTEPLGQPPKTSAIVVMMPRPTSAITTPDLAGRINEAVRLFRAKVAPQIILASESPSTLGVHKEEATAEIAVARASIAAQDVPNSAVETLIGGSDTYSLLVIVAKRVGSTSRVAIVTSAIADLWTKNAASSAGLVVARIYPSTGSKRFFALEADALWRQTTGVAVGRILGYQITTWVPS